MIKLHIVYYYIAIHSNAFKLKIYKQTYVYCSLITVYLMNEQPQSKQLYFHRQDYKYYSAKIIVL